MTILRSARNRARCCSIRAGGRSAQIAVQGSIVANRTARSGLGRNCHPTDLPPASAGAGMFRRRPALQHLFSTAVANVCASTGSTLKPTIARAAIPAKNSAAPCSAGMSSSLCWGGSAHYQPCSSRPTAPAPAPTWMWRRPTTGFLPPGINLNLTAPSRLSDTYFRWIRSRPSWHPEIMAVGNTEPSLNRISDFQAFPFSASNRLI